MLDQASAKVTNKMQFRFAQANVWDTKLDDKSVDAAVMVRLTRWLSPEQCQAALKELQRVARKMIIFTARVRNHPAARPLELFEQVLDGWKVSRNEAGYEDDYRIIMLEPIDGNP
jgi:ubiquinone/menaquinone biosynthesis C-methylase UbiE